MKLAPRQLADLANDVAHALGLKDPNDPKGALLSFDEPTTATATDAIYAKLGAALDRRRPSKHAPSIGEVLAVLVWGLRSERPTRWPSKPTGSWGRPGRDGARRALRELSELVAQGAYERTKRAERGRILAVLVLLFELEPLLEVEAADDLEETLRRVRRALFAR
jgi:hypothetical protein